MVSNAQADAQLGNALRHDHSDLISPRLLLRDLGQELSRLAASGSGPGGRSAEKGVRVGQEQLRARLGAAYRVTPDLVVRASYGVFYQGWISELRARTARNVPQAGGETLNNAALGDPDDQLTLTFADIFPAGRDLVLVNYPASTGTGTGYCEFPRNCADGCHMVDRESQVDPYYQRWMVDIQKSIGLEVLVSLSYQGARGTEPPYREPVNAPPYRTGWPDDVEYVDQFRPNSNGRFLDVRVISHGSNSFYNATAIKRERRLAQGLQFTSHYTRSKTVTEPIRFAAEYLDLWRTQGATPQLAHNGQCGSRSWGVGCRSSRERSSSAGERASSPHSSRARPGRSSAASPRRATSSQICRIASATPTCRAASGSPLDTSTSAHSQTRVSM